MPRDAITDSVITARIKGGILSDPGMTGSDVSVNTDRGVVSRTECDVTRGVLIEERVVEDRIERTDSSFPVDESELAETCAAIVLRDHRT